MNTVTTAPAPVAKRSIPLAGIILASMAAIVKFILPALPLFSGHSVAQATGICNGALGQLAQAFDHKAVTDCQTANTVSMVLTIVAVVLLAASIATSIRWARTRPSI